MKSLIVLGCCVIGGLCAASANADRAQQCLPVTAEMRILPAVEGQPVAFELRGPSCLPAGEALTNVQIIWGDGTTSPATATYDVDAATGSAVAQLHATHTYATASCSAAAGGSCYDGDSYRTSYTATTPNDGEIQTGPSWAVGVRAAPLRVTLVALRADHGIVSGSLARIRTGGTRKRSDLRATIEWGDGAKGRAKVTGAGRTFAVHTQHKYRRALPGTVHVKVYDGVAKRTYTAMAKTR
jgi:hypothetical protein